MEFGDDGGRSREERRSEFFDYVLSAGPQEGIKGFYYELIRLEAGAAPIHEGSIEAALNHIDARLDCADFIMLGILRILLQYRESPLLSGRLLTRAQASVLNFKYHPSEPGDDSMCTWTENHQIQFAVSDYLASAHFPDQVFTNTGEVGSERVDRAGNRIRQWLNLRERSGFNEWLSNVYYDEDMTALITLSDFAPDRALADRARGVLDQLFLDLASHTFRGAFGSSHGRTYTAEKQDAGLEATSDTCRLVFGLGRYSLRDNMSAVVLAVSRTYRVPTELEQVARDSRTAEIYHRSGIFIDEYRSWGLDPQNDEDAFVLQSFEAYTHPATIAATIRLFDRYRWWDNAFFAPFKTYRGLITVLRRLGELPLLAQALKWDITRNTREEVNVYTRRTGDYMLSVAQDYRPFYGGDQQHIWQATLGPRAVVFTTHPGSFSETTPNYWTGSGQLPRAVGIGNVAIVIYRVNRLPGLYHTNRHMFTHAWFPKDAFDEVWEQAGWILARKGRGYVALYSANPYYWQTKGPDAHREVVAPGRRNVWICQVGSTERFGNFQQFVSQVVKAEVVVGSGSSVRFHSPTEGLVRFGARGPLRVDGRVVEVSNYPRHASPWEQIDWPGPPGG